MPPVPPCPSPRWFVCVAVPCVCEMREKCTGQRTSVCQKGRRANAFGVCVSVWLFLVERGRGWTHERVVCRFCCCCCCVSCYVSMQTHKHKLNTHTKPYKIVWFVWTFLALSELKPKIVFGAVSGSQYVVNVCNDKQHSIVAAWRDTALVRFISKLVWVFFVVVQEFSLSYNTNLMQICSYKNDAYYTKELFYKKSVNSRLSVMAVQLLMQWRLIRMEWNVLCVFCMLLLLTNVNWAISIKKMEQPQRTGL